MALKNNAIAEPLYDHYWLLTSLNIPHATDQSFPKDAVSPSSKALSICWCLAWWDIGVLYWRRRRRGFMAPGSFVILMHLGQVSWITTNNYNYFYSLPARLIGHVYFFSINQVSINTSVQDQMDVYIVNILICGQRNGAMDSASDCCTIRGAVAGYKSLANPYNIDTWSHLP